MLTTCPMAKIAKPRVPAKMYRHFAFVTVGVTLLLAVFADGEGREAVVEHVQERERQAELQRISDRHTDRPHLTMRGGTAPTSFDVGESDNFGQATLKVHASGGSIPVRATGPQSAGQRALPGYSSAYLDSLSDEEYQKLLNQLRQTGMLSADERARNIAAMTRASRQRSGETTGSETLQ